MKSTKQTSKIRTKDIIHRFFMKIPIPVSITKAEDATYIEVNDAAVKYMGLRRNDIIGRKASELGHYPADKRHLYMDEVKKHGFAKDIPLELKIKNQGVLHMSFNVIQIKMGGETFLLSYATDISNQQPFMKKFQNDKFLKLTLPDPKFVKGKLRHYQLTPRQQEIALLSATGYSNPEIARKLHISEYTVKDHLKEIFRIIGVRSRSELFPKLINLR